VVSITLITSWLFLSLQYVIICYSWSNFASRDNGFFPFSFWWQWNFRMQKGPHMDLVWEMITNTTKDIGSIDCLVPSCFLLLKRLSKLRGMKAHWINITIYWSISSNISSTLEEQPWFELENDILCA